MATSTGSQQQADDFNKNRLPDLLFKKAQDTAAIGHPNHAIGDIMALIHRYPGQSDVKDWVKAARDLLPKVTPASHGTSSRTGGNKLTVDDSAVHKSARCTSHSDLHGTESASANQSLEHIAFNLSQKERLQFLYGTQENRNFKS